MSWDYKPHISLILLYKYDVTLGGSSYCDLLKSIQTHLILDLMVCKNGVLCDQIVTTHDSGCGDGYT